MPNLGRYYVQRNQIAVGCAHLKSRTRPRPLARCSAYEGFSCLGRGMGGAPTGVSGKIPRNALQLKRSAERRRERKTRRNVSRQNRTTSRGRKPFTTRERAALGILLRLSDCVT